MNTNADAALQAHVDKVIASDGVDDSRAVEVMARAFFDATANSVWGASDLDKFWADDTDEDATMCRHGMSAALNALRALEGE